MQSKNQLSRRQIRIKIFELVYANEVNDNDISGVTDKDLAKSIKQSEAAFTALVLFITKVFDYTLVYANQRASKYIQTADDQIDTSLARLYFIQQVQENESFIASIKEHKLNHLFPTEIIKKTFLKLRETDEYKAFHIDPTNEKLAENLVLRLVDQVLDAESNAYPIFDEKFINWEDDLEWIVKWALIVAKHPTQFAFEKTLDKDKAIFAKELLATYYEKQDYLFELIKPKLKNWEAERVAMIDLLLLKLGLAELLYFPAIPIKVSINEYIDLAKMYSTHQSGQFVNGVLDNLRKELEAKGDLRKFDNSTTNK
jgi:transcription antitermination protein NusB